MGRNGSQAKLAALLLGDWTNRQEYEETEKFKKYTKGLEATLNEVKRIGKTNNLDEIIRAEEITIEQELEFYGQTDKSIIPSLRAAGSDFEVIKESIQIVRIPEKYQNAAATYHHKKKLHGVVADGFHEAVNSHITRLGNRISALGVSEPEKAILRQRLANMRTAKNLYVELQKDALKIMEPSKKTTEHQKTTEASSKKKTQGPER